MRGYWRFQRRVPVGRWFRINVGKRGASATLGRRRGGPHLTVRQNGDVSTSVGLPGTGLSYVARFRARVWNPCMVGAVAAIVIVVLALAVL